MKHTLEGLIPAPLLEAPMTGLVGRIPIARKIFPARSAAQDPQDPVQDIARILARTPASILPPPRLANPRRQECPLFFRQTHPTAPRVGGNPWRMGAELSAGDENYTSISTLLR